MPSSSPSRPAASRPFDLLGLDPVELDLGAVVEPGVLEALDDRQVGVGEIDVLADEPDLHRRGRGVDLGDELARAG